MPLAFVTDNGIPYDRIPGCEWLADAPRLDPKNLVYIGLRLVCSWHCHVNAKLTSRLVLLLQCATSMTLLLQLLAWDFVGWTNLRRFACLFFDYGTLASAHRDVDPGERRWLRDNACGVFTMNEIDKHGIGKVMEMALECVLKVSVDDDWVGDWLAGWQLARASVQQQNLFFFLCFSRSQPIWNLKSSSSLRTYNRTDSDQSTSALTSIRWTP